jgi:hypothetical protein
MEDWLITLSVSCLWTNTLVFKTPCTNVLPLKVCWLMYILLSHKIWKFVTMVHWWKYYVFGHFPSSCLYLETALLTFKNTEFRRLDSVWSFRRHCGVGKPLHSDRRLTQKAHFTEEKPSTSFWINSQYPSQSIQSNHPQFEQKSQWSIWQIPKIQNH